MTTPRTPRVKWVPFVVDGRPSLAVKRATEDRSGAYAIRRKDSKSVIYVGESHVGRLWRTMSRHFQAPDTFTSKAPKGGKNAFATDRPADYEVAWRVTKRGKLTKATADQRAMNEQAKWIAAFRAAGHPLKNVSDGMADAEGDDSFDFGANVKEDDRPWYENPSPPLGALVELGKLTEIAMTGITVYTWPLRDAPVLAYDERGQLFIVYTGKIVGPSTKAQRREYARTHWGQSGPGHLREGGTAPAPHRLGAEVSSVTYTTQKGLQRKLVDYEHLFGEGASRGTRVIRPRIARHECPGGCGSKCAARGALALSGGTYQVNARGIVG